MGDNELEEFDCYLPEFWANEVLAILEENIVMYNLLLKDGWTQ